MMGAEVLLVSIPGHGSFTVTGDAAAMIDVFGGLLHCYQGGGGCRKQGLYFSRTEPKKPLRCRVELPDTSNTGSRGAENRGGGDRGETDITISVSHELARN